MTVAFVFTNPRHHLEMMSPVATVLERRGVPVRMISLAEVRGFRTPTDDRRLRRAIPFQLRDRSKEPSPTSGAASAAAPRSRSRLAQRAVWQVLKLWLRLQLRGARVVVVPNDAVFPYTELVDDVHRRGAATVLLQEGIRFPLPAAYTGPTYGGHANAAICAWGAGSKDYFVGSRIPADTIEVTGTPRLDDLDAERLRTTGVALYAEHGITTAPLAFLSNPIEIQGYGDKAVKLDLFARMLAGIAPVVRARRLPIIVKNHLHEDPADFAQVAAASPVADLVTVIPRGPIFPAIAAARAAVVLTSTVGLEALALGIPIAVLEIPGHEPAFEYVQRGAATYLRLASAATDLDDLLADRPERRAAAAAFLDRHLHDRGRARHNVADVIERVLAK